MQKEYKTNIKGVLIIGEYSLGNNDTYYLEIGVCINNIIIKHLSMKIYPSEKNIDRQVDDVINLYIEYQQYEHVLELFQNNIEDYKCPLCSKMPLMQVAFLGNEKMIVYFKDFNSHNVYEYDKAKNQHVLELLMESRDILYKVPLNQSYSKIFNEVVSNAVITNNIDGRVLGDEEYEEILYQTYKEDIEDFLDLYLRTKIVNEENSF